MAIFQAVGLYPFTVGLLRGVGFFCILSAKVPVKRLRMEKHGHHRPAETVMDIQSIAASMGVAVILDRNNQPAHIHPIGIHAIGRGDFSKLRAGTPISRVISIRANFCVSFSMSASPPRFGPIGQATLITG